MSRSWYVCPLSTAAERGATRRQELSMHIQKHKFRASLCCLQWSIASQEMSTVRTADGGHAKLLGLATSVGLNFKTENCQCPDFFLMFCYPQRHIIKSHGNLKTSPTRRL